MVINSLDVPGQSGGRLRREKICGLTLFHDSLSEKSCRPKSEGLALRIRLSYTAGVGGEVMLDTTTVSVGSVGLGSEDRIELYCSSCLVPLV